MDVVDPERFKRFQAFLQRHLSAFAEVAGRGFAMSGPGVVIYRAPDDRLEGQLPTLKLEYKTKAAIDSAQGETRDELIQGMLERYKPPGEALFVAIYPDRSYDVSRVILKSGWIPPARSN